MGGGIDDLIIESQEQHRRYHGLFGHNPAGGDGLRDLGTYSRSVGKQATSVRDGVMRLDFSTNVMGPFAQETGWDHLPLDGFGGAAGRGGIAADGSAQNNVDGGNAVAGNADAEAAEIAAVPDPNSPAGKASILAIIQKYQSQSSGTVADTSASEQANGAQAATGGSDNDSSDDDDGHHHHHHDDDDDSGGMGSGSGGGLMDILSSLLGGGGMGGLGSMMSPEGMGGMGGGMSPYGSDPYAMTAGANGAAPAAADPFASTPIGAAAGNTTGASAGTSADPFASTPSTGASTVGNTSGEPAGSGEPAAGGGAQNNGGNSEAKTTGATSTDLSAFATGDNTSVPADPAAG
ncbi:hypothetical protein [Mycobacterium servetii]|uniref:Uncharacterized protein n=1 Tax=Mycobacterium servetii TaxID=3237418 RepID=A0ABV4C9I5_9MYCO